MSIARQIPCYSQALEGNIFLSFFSKDKLYKIRNNLVSRPLIRKETCQFHEEKTKWDFATNLFTQPYIYCYDWNTVNLETCMRLFHLIWKIVYQGVGSFFIFEVGVGDMYEVNIVTLGEQLLVLSLWYHMLHVKYEQLLVFYNYGSILLFLTFYTCIIIMETWTNFIMISIWTNMHKSAALYCFW